jgi:hypothetical protein
LQRLLDGETGTRTRDTTIFSRVLYQLSYLAEITILAFSGTTKGDQVALADDYSAELRDPTRRRFSCH